MNHDDPQADASRRSIDWEAIRRRLDAVRGVIEATAAPSPEMVRKILHERAGRLARQAQAEHVAETIDVLECEIAEERYGFELAYIREVYPLQSLTPLPGAPAFMPGIVNVRGRILSVIDIRKFFDLPDRGLSDLNRVVILASGEREIGVLTDRIVGTRRLPLDALQDGLPTLDDVRAQYLKGVTGDRLIVLNPGEILRGEPPMARSPAER